MGSEKSVEGMDRAGDDFSWVPDGTVVEAGCGGDKAGYLPANDHGTAGVVECRYDGMGAGRTTASLGPCGAVDDRGAGKMAIALIGLQRSGSAGFQCFADRRGGVPVQRIDHLAIVFALEWDDECGV